MGRLIEDLKLRGKRHVFKDRTEAGRQLSLKLSAYSASDALVLAIPAGGVPVASEVSKGLKLPMDVLIVRKIQMPGATEAGFGAVGPDGEAIFNERLLRSLRLTKEVVEQQVEKTRKVLEARNRLYREAGPFPELHDKTVILVDDGLASGYTMSEAVRFVKRKGVQKVIIAAPTASESSINLLLPEVDEIYILNIRGLPFAVAEAYQQWYDVGDEEVLSILKNADTFKREGKNER